MNISDAELMVQTVQTDAEFEAVFSLRAQVLQDEFGLPEEFDLDGHDHISHHYLALANGEPVGTARWRITLGRKVKLERFAVLPPHRKKGIGKILLDAIMRDLPKGMEIFLEAHESVSPFYEKYGFQKDGNAYDVSEIPHQRMIFPV